MEITPPVYTGLEEVHVCIRLQETTVLRFVVVQLYIGGINKDSLKYLKITTVSLENK